MAKNIIINDGNYKISVDDTNSIILDVGATGVVQVTGDLQVDGTQTTVNSSILEIKLSNSFWFFIIFIPKLEPLLLGLITNFFNLLLIVINFFSFKSFVFKR